jgi:hypothetical protein
MISIFHVARPIQRIVTVALVCAFTLAVGTAPSYGVRDASTKRATEALQELQRFKSSHSFKDLEAAIATMQSAFEGYTFASEDFYALRRALVWNWAQILKVVQDSYDPTFNPANRNDVPSIHLIPPMEANGTQLSSGVDPRDIQDPKARAIYVAELGENAAKRKRLDAYLSLENVDDEAKASLEVSLDLLRTMAPEGATPDAAALDSILRKAGLKDATRRELYPFFLLAPAK